MKWSDFIFWTLVVLSLGLGIGGCTSVRHERLEANALIDVHSQTIEDQGTIIKNLLVENAELSSTLDEATKNITTLMTFQDADFEVTIDTVRDLLDLAKTLPYGRPMLEPFRITSEFGMRTIQRYGWVDQEHLGIDIVSLTGNWTVYMPVEGYISDWGWSDLYGNYIEITTESGYRLFMAHLDYTYFPHVTEDGVWHINPEVLVPQGTRIGIAGSTGKYATGRHLHYEVWILRDDTYVPLDPDVILKYTGGHND